MTTQASFSEQAIAVMVGALREVYRRGEKPDLEGLTQVFCERDYNDEGDQLTSEEHLQGLASGLITTMAMLAEATLDDGDDSFTLRVAINNAMTEELENVSIRVWGFSDPRLGVAALANLSRDDYIKDIWDAVSGTDNPESRVGVVRLGENEKSDPNLRGRWGERRNS